MSKEIHSIPFIRVIIFIKVSLIKMIIVIIILITIAERTIEKMLTLPRVSISSNVPLTRVNTVLIQTNGTLVGLGERGTGRTSAVLQNASIAQLRASMSMRR